MKMGWAVTCDKCGKSFSSAADYHKHNPCTTRRPGRPRPDYDPRIDWPERHTGMTSEP